MSPDTPAAPADRTRPALPWVVRGWRAAHSFAGLILCLAFVGFGAFARDAGFTFWQVVGMGPLVWALPSCVVFVAAMTAGASLPAAAFAVALSAVRLLPMTVAIVPQMAAERVRRIWFYVAAHFIAVTGYVEAILRLPHVPADVRLSFFLGLGIGLMTNATAACALGYLAAGVFPAPVATGLVFVTPVYFLLSLFTAGALTERIALALGFALLPLAHWIEPELDLLWAGLIAGTVAHVIGRRRRG